MRRPIIPTNPDEERAKGRVALWLDPDDLRWLATHLRELPTTTEEQEHINRLYFRAHAALHKAGLSWQTASDPNDTDSDKSR